MVAETTGMVDFVGDGGRGRWHGGGGGILSIG